MDHLNFCWYLKQGKYGQYKQYDFKQRKNEKTPAPMAYEA